jgi:PAS domain S-box-containing protein
MLHQVMSGGEPTRSRDMLLLPRRNGFFEESYFSFSYSPIRDETGGIGGIFTPVIETTANVIGERRLKTLRDLGAGSAATLDVASTLSRAAAALSGNPYDLPFAVLYLVSPDRAQLTLAGSTGLPTPCALFPGEIVLQAPCPFPAQEECRDAAAGEARVTSTLAAALAATPLPANPWPDAPGTTAFLPITPAGYELPSAVLVCGLSPRLAFDDSYREFLDLACGQIGTALADAMAYEAERRRSEAIVGERTAERDRIWRISQEMLVVLGPDGILRAANPAWQRILGYTESELVGHHVRHFIHPDDLGQSLARITRFQDGPFSPAENRYRHKDGSLRWIAWGAVAESGLIYAVGRDITSEKRQAEALAKTEDALRQAQKMEAVGQLTGGIAHDFNNLLQSISSGVELMRRRIADGRPQDAERFVEAAQKAIERAAALTHRLLAFSRRQALSPKHVDVGDLLEGTCELIRQTMGPSIELRVQLKEKSWPVRCDPNQLENAILNLAINARDAMPEGGTLLIESEHAVLSEADIAGATGAYPGEYVRITTRDTGTGMAKDVLDRAFEPFFTTKPAGQGTGLGLSQVYGFISQSNGMIRLESVPGEGTSVHLFIPRDIDAGVDGSDTASLFATSPPRAVSSATVLLVDDETDLRAHSAEALREIGCRVVEACDGPTALNALRDALLHDGGGIDMLVSDIGLPGGLTGRQLADIARDMLPDLPVLLVTGYTGEADPPALAPGMTYLKKPFTLEAFTTRIKAMLHG